MLLLNVVKYYNYYLYIRKPEATKIAKGLLVVLKE